MSCDEVFFYTHSTRFAASNNKFNGLLCSSDSKKHAGGPDILPLPESSVVVNVLLHTVYDIPCDQYSPSLAVLHATLRTLLKYDLPLHSYISRRSVVFDLLAHVPTSPLEVYTIAAEYDIYELAADASARLISLDISSISDEMAARMGAAYFMRLCLLSQRHKDILRNLLLVPLAMHTHWDGGGGMECAGAAVARAWSREVADLAWEATPCTQFFMTDFV